jgi:hypothetical protein
MALSMAIRLIYVLTGDSLAHAFFFDQSDGISS